MEQIIPEASREAPRFPVEKKRVDEKDGSLYNLDLKI